MLAIVEGNKKNKQKNQPLLVDEDTAELRIHQPAPQKQFKFRRLIDNILISICTCCHWQRIKRFRNRNPLCSYLILYTSLTFILAIFGGIIFNRCEYDHEYAQINTKTELYNQIRSQLPESAYEDLDMLLDMEGVPMAHHKNRWRIQTATFFAFTTASTIGYGFTTPQTFWGKFATFLYGLPAICVFGLAMVQIGSAVARTVDKTIKEKQEIIESRTNITTKLWYQQCFAWLSVELRRTIFVFALLILIIAISGAIFNALQSNWTYTDGLYFMWISISTIGYGDLHPDVIETTLWANVLIWIGLAMTALVIGASQDYFQKKIKKWRQEDLETLQTNLTTEQKDDDILEDTDNYRMLATSDPSNDTLATK